jgi:hypothetical protein
MRAGALPAELVTEEPSQGFAVFGDLYQLSALEPTAAADAPSEPPLRINERQSAPTLPTHFARYPLAALPVVGAARKASRTLPLLIGARDSGTTLDDGAHVLQRSYVPARVPDKLMARDLRLRCTPASSKPGSGGGPVSPPQSPAKNRMLAILAPPVYIRAGALPGGGIYFVDRAASSAALDQVGHELAAANPRPDDARLRAGEVRNQDVLLG